jgi:hypothetical protein
LDAALRKKILLAGLGLLCLGVLSASALRVRGERARRSVEICVNWKETEDLVRKNPFRREVGDYVSLDGFLERCRIIGVSSVAEREETLQDLIASGKIIYLPSSEIEKFRALGLSSEDSIRDNLLWVRGDPGLVKRIGSALDRLENFPVYEKGRLKTRKIGDYTLLEIPASWEPLLGLSVGVAPAHLEVLERYGLKRAALIEESPKILPQENLCSTEGVTAWAVLGLAPDLRRKRFYASSDVIRQLKDGSSKYLLFEGQPFPYGRLLGEVAGAPERVVRAHTIPLDELKMLTPQAAAARWIRAARERSCRFLYFRWNPDWSVEENLSVLRSVAQKLKSSGYRLEPLSNGTPSAFVRFPLLGLREMFALLAAILGPLAAVRFLRSRPADSWKSAAGLWAAALAACLLTGGLIVTLLPDTVFADGGMVFRGVKAALVIPLLGSAFLLFSPEEIRSVLARSVTVSNLLIFLGAAAALQLMIDRSGNFASAPHPWELTVRSLLENALIARPRFKEFLIGHPLMILGLYLMSAPAGFRDPSFGPSTKTLGRIFVWAGTVGLVSVVNSFCHLHTPLSLTLLRTFHGAWIGGVLGLLLVWTWRVFRGPQTSSAPAPSVP